MASRTYPRLSNLLGAWFHQDYDIEGENVEDIISAYKAVTPAADRAELKSEIEMLLAQNPRDLNAVFETTFRPDVDVAAFSGSVRAFLEEVRALVG